MSSDSVVRSLTPVAYARAVPGSDLVLIVTGPPAAGKTTVARALAGSRPRAVHLEADAFFHFVAGGYVEPWLPESHSQNGVVMDAVAAAAARYAAGGYFTIVDGIVAPRWLLHPLRDSLAGARCRVAYVVLRPPLAVCEERVRARERGPLADSGVVERLWREFADLGPLESHVIETGSLTREAAADVIERRLEEGRLEV